MRYIIFSRVSTNKQLDNSQLLMCREYIGKIKKPGDEVIEFNEPPTSTRLTIDERPVLKECLEFLKKGDSLVVFDLSRLARTGTEIVKIYEEQITNKKVFLHSLGEPKVDKNFIHIYAMMNEIARDTISNKTKAGLRSKQAEMHKVGATWFGYKTDPTKLQLERKLAFSYGKPYLLIPEETESKAVEIMKEMYRNGATLGEIERSLEKQGFVNRKGNPLYKATITRVLTRLGIHNPIPSEIKSNLFRKKNRSSSAP